MIRRLSILALIAISMFCVSAQAEPPPKGQRVFTCGHSFHIWVVPLLEELAKNAGIAGHVVAGKSAIGGSTVLKHWEVPEEKNLAKQALKDGKVDVLTLSPIWLPDVGIDNFVQLGFEHNPNLRVTVDAADLAALKKAQEQYDLDIENYVAAINQKLGKDVISVVPIGPAVVALREKIKAGKVPSIKTQAELFRDSWGHPTAPIQAISAYAHYAVIYKRSPVGLPRLSILAKSPAWANDELNHLLQELAWEAVTHHPLTGLSPQP
jgi:hypothetical protein